MTTSGIGPYRVVDKSDHEHVYDGCDGGICVLCGACNHPECQP